MHGDGLRVVDPRERRRRASSFIGFDRPELQQVGFNEFAKLTIWVGRSVSRACNVTTASFGTDSGPAWSVDDDFCTCTPAFPGGG